MIKPAVHVRVLRYDHTGAWGRKTTKRFKVLLTDGETVMSVFPGVFTGYLQDHVPESQALKHAGDVAALVGCSIQIWERNQCGVETFQEDYERPTDERH